MADEGIRPEMEAVYVISVAAALAGMHPQTLRVYERRGLLEPFRTPGGTRRYSDADLDRLSMIQDLTAQGINIEGVKHIISLSEENLRLRTRLREMRSQRNAALAAVEALRQQRRQFRGEIMVRSELLRLPPD